MSNRQAQAVTALEMAGRQREISVSEFFLKNRHLLGFDTPAKALVTAVKEAVDNALDACEEAGVLPELTGEVRGRFEPSSMTGDENDVIFDYKRRHPDFPHENTIDQFFGEEQLEAYRALGFHMVHEILDPKHSLGSPRNFAINAAQGKEDEARSEALQKLRHALRGKSSAEQIGYLAG